MMNKFNTIVKVISALAAVVGAVYIVATYGDKMVAWAKRLLGCDTAPIATFHYTADEKQKTEEAPAEAAPKAEEAEQTAPAAEEKTEEAAPEAPAAPAAEESTEAPAAEEGAPVANEEDFEG